MEQLWTLHNLPQNFVIAVAGKGLLLFYLKNMAIWWGKFLPVHYCFKVGWFPDVNHELPVDCHHFLHNFFSAFKSLKSHLHDWIIEKP